MLFNFQLLFLCARTSINPLTGDSEDKDSEEEDEDAEEEDEEDEEEAEEEAEEEITKKLSTAKV